MNKTLFVINPASGGVKKDDLIDHIKSNYPEAKIHQTNGKNDKEEIRQTLEDGQYTRVIAGGGDGTIALVANEIHKSDSQTSLGIIPLGSANGLAMELDIPTEPTEALKKAFNESAKPFDIISINNQWNVLHMADFGMNATLVKRYQDENRRGFLGYAISGLKELGNLMTAYSFELTIGNKTQILESTFVIIANARRYGTGIEVNPGGMTDDGKFEICCLQRISFERYLNQFINEEEFELNPFQIFSSDKAKIQLNSKADLQVDGEYIGVVDALDIQIQKGAIQLVY